MAVNEVLSRIAPGQTGTLSQGTGKWREFLCREVLEDTVLLSLSKEKGEGSLTTSAPALFQTVCENGMLRCLGGIRQATVSTVEFTPKMETFQIVNRRDAFRVPVSLKAELAGATKKSEETFNTVWPCSLRDMSIGGTKLMLGSPAPAPRSQALLRVQLPTEEKPVIISCLVIEATSKRSSPPMDAMVRVAFHSVTNRLENQLSRFINWAQIDMMKKGIR